MSTLALEFAESEAGLERLKTCTGVLGYNRDSGKIVPLWIAPQSRTDADVVTIILATNEDVRRATAIVQQAKGAAATI
jgi:hypothetical protein